MRAWLLAFGTLATAIGLIFARPHTTPGPPMRDFEAYYAAGAVWNAGGDPYSQTIWRVEQHLPGVDARRYEALPFVAPPATLPLFGSLARVPFALADAVWRALLIVTLALFALRTLALTQQRITIASFFGIAIVALGFGPLTSALALGQLALPAGLFALLTLSSAPFAFLAWIQPNIAAALCALTLSWRGTITFTASLGLFVGACALVAGLQGVTHYAQVLHRHGAAEEFAAIQVTPAAVAYGFGATPASAHAIGAAIGIATVTAWLMLMRRTDDSLARFCATCAILPLVIPFFHEHSLLIVFVPAVVYAIRANGTTQHLALLGALIVATDWLGLAQRPDGTLQTLLLVAACGCGIVALRQRPNPRMLLIPVSVLAAIGVACIFAHAYPAPVWPDAMRALPRDIVTADIASAWHSEQHATGLISHNVVWAALRLLSLLGCALTATAIAASSKYPADSRISSPVPA
jgi:hypothetical protein